MEGIINLFLGVGIVFLIIFLFAVFSSVKNRK
ncbi:hypothetical protein SAMN05421676_108115 [Salinibacillus kushneri]|uniref:Holin-like Toxin (Hol-Tox) n=1 Tax=Salinibacillus kushneri TaxID=237682 RepID=A0A1I0H979_9BACI|nr:hypothetical protein SAMN05421676_108115 [Salinibacillus kushneri]